MSVIKEFQNGFQSWMETHHEVVTFIAVFLIEVKGFPSDKSVQSTSVIQKEYGLEGTTAMYELAEKWTDEFELLNKGRDWDGEFYEEVEVFCMKKNKL
jgi:hypothetical protein